MSVELKSVSLDESLARWSELERRHRAGELQAGFVVTIDREGNNDFDAFAGDAEDPCPITLAGVVALLEAASGIDWAMREFAGDLWHAGAFGDPMHTAPPEGIAFKGAWALDLIAKWSPAVEPQPDLGPKGEMLQLLGIAESHIGTARVAIDVGHLGRLSEELTRAIGTLRQVSSASGASKLADAVATEVATRIRCHACERPLYAAPGPEERGPQRTASMHLVVATRRRVVTKGDVVDIGEYPHVCSFTCFDKIIATWPAHPKRDEMLAEHTKGRSYRNELYGVHYIGEQLLEDVADAHLSRALERSGG